MLVNYAGIKHNATPVRCGIIFSYAVARAFPLLYGLLPCVLRKMFTVLTSQLYRTHNRRDIIPHPGNRHQR